jgi:hypothetical protein
MGHSRECSLIGEAFWPRLDHWTVEQRTVDSTGAFAIPVSPVTRRSLNRLDRLRFAALPPCVVADVGYSPSIPLKISSISL